MLDSKGYLRIRALSAGGALPVEGVSVRILGADEYNRFTSFSLLTDRDGLTESLSLPTPSVGYSLTPSPAELPFALYDVEIRADGYYPKKLIGVSVFPGIESVQPIIMIPIPKDPSVVKPEGYERVTIPSEEV